MRHKSLGHLIGRDINARINDTIMPGSAKKTIKYTVVAAYPHFVVAERKNEDGLIIRETFNYGSLVEMGIIDGGYKTEVIANGWNIGIRR